MKPERIPRITFGIIVLNGEPFTRYCLRSIYSFAHEIIVAEGASERARESATSDGHSTDGTLEVLRRFQQEEDPEGKLQVVVRDGFWIEKDEQSRAYAEKATGDYLWQVDIDEFYHPEDIRRILELLNKDPSISGLSFYWKNFWGGFDSLADGWAYRDAMRASNGLPRLFRWAKGYCYASHRPATVVDQQGRKLISLNWLGADSTANLNLYCYHYGMLFPKQAIQKAHYYKKMWKSHEDMDRWRKESFLELKKPYRILHGLNPPSWLAQFRGQHPQEIQRLIEDLKKGKIAIEQRPAEDIERLLRSGFYRVVTGVLALLYPLYSSTSRFVRGIPDTLRKLPYPILRPIRMMKALLRKFSTPSLEALPMVPDLFQVYRALHEHPLLKRAQGGWHYQGKFYPDYITVGSVSHGIFQTATKYCNGTGIDIGAGFWPLPGSTAVDSQSGEGLSKTVDDFQDGSLDYVFSSHCLERIEEWRPALQRWIAKLRSGGTLFLYLPHPDCEIWQPGSPFVGDRHKWVPTSQKMMTTLLEMGCELVAQDHGPDAMYSFFICVRKI